MNTSCTPWNFPTQDIPGLMCDPWISYAIERTMFRDMPDGKCEYCLPDCTETQFTTFVTSVPFRRCDYKNLGVSYLCDFKDPLLPEPRIWGRQVLVEYNKRAGEVPEYITNQVWFANSSAKFRDLLLTIKMFRAQGVVICLLIKSSERKVS